MPDLVPVPWFEPPSRLDHIAAHPALFAAALHWMMFGAFMVGPVIVPWDWYPSPIFGLPPRAIATVFGVMILLCGLVTLWMVQTTYRRADIIWTVARSVLLTATLTWAGFTFVVLYMNTGWVLAWSMGLAHCLIAALSLWSVHRAERSTRAGLRAKGYDA